MRAVHVCSQSLGTDLLVELVLRPSFSCVCVWFGVLFFEGGYLMFPLVLIYIVLCACFTLITVLQ